MRKILGLVLVGLIVSLLAGCGSKAVYHHDDLNDPNKVTRVERKNSFWASENLQMYYDSEAQARATHERLARETSAQLIASHNRTVYETNVERILAEFILRQQLQQLATYHGTGVAPPRTMVDQNWPALLGVASNWAQFFLMEHGDYNKSNSPSQSIKGDGNIFIYDSDIGSGSGSQADIYFGDYSDVDAASSGESSLVLDNARPYSLSNYTDNSRMTTTSRINESYNPR